MTARIERRISDAWPGTTLDGPPQPLHGGFWASMFRLRLVDHPPGVPDDVVFRIAPDTEMGAKELAVQRSVAEMGYPTPRVRLGMPFDDELGGSWTVMDFVAGASPLEDLNGLAALRRAPALLRRLPHQLAEPMAALHALDPDPVSAAVADVAPRVAWNTEQLLQHFEVGAVALERPDLVAAVHALRACQPEAGRTVICHGDLHPFNLLVHHGDVTVIDWTAAIKAEPVYDLAFTALLLANPPLESSRPIAAFTYRVGAHLANKFIARYLAIASGNVDSIEWYRALHGARILIEAESLLARDNGEATRHPFGALLPAATHALRAVVGSQIKSMK